MKLRQPILGLLTAVAVCLASRSADAVIIYLKGQSHPVRGYFVRENENAVVVDELRGDGTTIQRTIPRSEIEDLLRSVSEDRLSALSSDAPDGYREYAEELAEKRKDPDAQMTGIRLFQIAANLQPHRLGRSCLLGMTPLARNETERRRFRAMAYLLDPAHDPELLKQTPVKTARSTELEPRQAEFLLTPFRFLRQGKRGSAMQRAKHVKLQERLPLLTDTITYEEFEQACEPKCPYCVKGQQRCPACDGRGFNLRAGLTRVSCTNCGAQGNSDCTHCGGNFKNNPISPSLLKRIVRIELDWLPGDGDQPAEEPRPVRPGWSRSVQLGHVDPATPLTFATLTEFDPRLCHYRNGKWVE